MKANSASRAAALLALLCACGSAPALAQSPEKVANRVAVFTGLDKITGRIITFDVYIDETVQFGALRVTPRVCYTRPSTETPQTDAFVEVDVIRLDSRIERVFSGWMFAASPGLNAIEHPVYDVWLNDCRQESDILPPGERQNGAERQAQPNPEAIEAPSQPLSGAVPIPRPKPPIETFDGEFVDPEAPVEGPEPDVED